MSSPPTGVGTPIRIVINPTETVPLGGSVQLTPTLADVNGTPQTVVYPFTFKSSNTALLTIDDDGLCTAVASQAGTLQAGGFAQVEIQYPWCGVPTSGSIIYATVTFTILGSDVISAFVPLAPGFDLEFAENNTGSCGQGGCGWKVIPTE